MSTKYPRRGALDSFCVSEQANTDEWVADAKTGRRRAASSFVARPTVVRKVDLLSQENLRFVMSGLRHYSSGRQDQGGVSANYG